VPSDAVYDLEVAEHHNFALTAGVFVHNTFFQGRTIDVKIQKDVALYYAHEEAERPFYGVSMFESAFYHYDKKVKLYYIAHLAAQRSAVGLRVGTMPPNPAANDAQNFKRGLADLGLAQYIVLPSGDWQVQNLKEEGNFDFLGLINHHNSAMSKSILAEWFDQNQGGDTAVVDFGQQSDATFMMMLEGILNEMSEVIDQHIFPRFVDWNFGSGKYPSFKWGELTAEQKAALQTLFGQLATAGQQANITPEFMLSMEKRMAEYFGFPIDYDTIEKEQEKQKQQQQQMQQAQLKAVQNPQPAQPGQPGQPGTPSQPSGQQGGSSQLSTPANLLPSGFQAKPAAAAA
jgi:hypothetical protein